MDLPKGEQFGLLFQIAMGVGAVFVALRRKPIPKGKRTSSLPVSPHRSMNSPSDFPSDSANVCAFIGLVRCRYETERRAWITSGLPCFELVLSRSMRIRAGYSWRNALMGSTRVARRAGIYVAKRATRNMAPGTTR